MYKKCFIFSEEFKRNISVAKLIHSFLNIQLRKISNINRKAQYTARSTTQTINNELTNSSESPPAFTTQFKKFKCIIIRLYHTERTPPKFYPSHTYTRTYTYNDTHIYIYE